MKNAYYFTVKALFVFKYKIDLIRKVIFKIHDVMTWLTKNCDTHIDQYLAICAL